ncbi:uncharacterized protein [Medicago truncatula]|nr:uncharacterized protein LOC11420919 [Medicago truncatula]
MLNVNKSIEGEKKRSRYQQVGMGKYKVPILLLCVFFNLHHNARTYSPLEREIEAKLKLLNKPAVKSIRSQDGDIIDCVNIYEQPAFDHPALKNHSIQRVPNFLLESQISRTGDGFNVSSDVYQTWQKSGSCPEETVPIRRIRKEDLLRAVSLARFGQKPPEVFVNSINPTNLNFSNLNANDGVVDLKNRSDALLVAYAFQFIGAQANINVWNPKVEKPEDFTTAQIWLKAANGPDNFESIEAGWTVNPKLYGDHNTRFFVYWTKDTYKSTGCFDLTCKGFVQTNKDIALGATLGPVSVPSHQQYEINVGIFRDNSGNWWLKVKNNIPVGYWPKELVSNLQSSASLVQWGGQVFSYEVKKTPHTGTQMGSGEEAYNKFGVACYMGGVRIKDNSQALKYPSFVSTHAIEPYCYSAFNDAPYGKDPVFYFGGAGRRPPHCP